jgi:SAM-dependent methyltransferase
MRRGLRQLLPLPARRRLAGWWNRARRRRVDFGDLRRLTPLSREFGFDRGLPIDRYYIEGFLERNAEAIRGRVLEVGTAAYTKRFGGARVTSSEVLHVSETKPDVTLIGDLTDDQLAIPDADFDCVILTQVLQFVFDVPAALRTVHRLLRPGGELLVTAAAVSPTSRYDAERWGEHWRFTSGSIGRLLRDALPDCDVRVQAEGNVLSATAFLYGLASEELDRSELEHADPDFEVVVCARVRKPS